eukprot:scaffold216275_cov16-Prasinocladus_malaysianus.AAC.1
MQVETFNKGTPQTSQTAGRSELTDRITLRCESLVCFSLIPELFPKNRSSAMAVYNSAIYLGRALSFAGLFVFSGMAASSSLGVHLLVMSQEFGQRLIYDTSG